MASISALQELQSASLSQLNNGVVLTDAVCMQVSERGILIAGESGIFTPEDVAFVQSTGCGAILVGESLVKTGDPAAAVKALLS